MLATNYTQELSMYDSDYAKFPPKNLLTIVLLDHADCAMLYIQLYQDRIDDTVTARKDDITEHYLMSNTLFRNRLLKLQRLALVCVRETQKKYIIEFRHG